LGFNVLHLGEWYRLVSSMFLHNGAMHILFNMFSLYVVGSVLERLISRWAYLVIYFISGIVGGLFFIFFNPVGNAVGASGAIFGIFGALAGFAYVHRKTHPRVFLSFVQQFGIILLLNFVLGVVMENIAMSAHVGGLLSGMLLGGVIARYPHRLSLITLVSVVGLVMGYGYLMQTIRYVLIPS